MGVPAFFRWLSKKYVSVIVPCIEEKPKELNGITIPVDATKENPNGVEFDNLYLDMNGIIHPCTHPEDKPAPKNEDEMMIAIFECIDRLFNIVRPRKLLYMAIDGVAPRAKMNQQRSRRFRAAKESVEKIDEVARLRSELAEKGCFLPPEKPRGEHFDSNCITPGTPFMARLSTCLHYYIHDRMNNNPAWKGIKIILSDANVPGEGEHKIMDYIRKQRAQPDHDPNTQHCLCGADADLIMLGLATHEPYFTIIREEFKPNKPKPCDICGQMGHEMKDCCGLERPADDNENAQPDYGTEGEFIFVRLNILREYLEKELEMPNLPFTYDFERAIDDWVFMCFFVGNDFLPHLPSLEIREGAIDRLVTLYKKAVYKTGGFLTDSGDVKLDRVQLIMADLGEVEDQIFKKRQQDELAFKARMKAKNKRMKAVQNFRPNWVPQGQYAPTPLGRNVNPIQNPRQAAYEGRMDSRGQRGGFGFNSQDNQRGQKRKADDMDSEEEEEPHDEVRLWEDGFKERYYESKFDVESSNIKFRHRLALEYVRGLCWVLRYYYQGCASWKWYFPYHYAPFASDFLDIGDLPTTFEKGTKPFQPLQQLMGVFPAASSSHVPAPWAKLMSNPDSPIIDFYPEDFKIDLNGKKFAWQGVALLPFVDETRMFKALEHLYDSLTAAEIRRNVRGDDRLYVTPGNSGYHFIGGLYENEIDYALETEIMIDGMRGAVLLAEDCVDQGGSLSSPVTGLPVINRNIVSCIRYRDPQYSETFIFPAKRLKGAVSPPRVLKPQDLTPKQNRDWRPQIGMSPATKRASLGDAGHRMLGHHQRATGSGIYSSVPPLMNNPPFNGAMVQQLLTFVGGGNQQSWSGGYGQQQYGGQRHSWHGSGYGSNQTSGDGFNSNRNSGGGNDFNRSSGGGNDFNRSGGGGYDSSRNSAGRYDSNRNNSSGRFDSDRNSSGGRFDSNRSSIGSYSSDRGRGGGGFDSNRSSGGSYVSGRNSTGGYDTKRASGASTYEPNRSGGANSNDSNRYTARTSGGTWSSSPNPGSGGQRGAFGGNQQKGEDLYSRNRNSYGGNY